MKPSLFYQMSPEIQLRWEGFAKLTEFLQGALWALTGNLQASHFVCLSCLLIWCGIIWAKFRVNPAWMWLALLSIPLVQIHSVLLPFYFWIRLRLMLTHGFWRTVVGPRAFNILKSGHPVLTQHGTRVLAQQERLWKIKFYLFCKIQLYNLFLACF
jgi:hypothetical protein